MGPLSIPVLLAGFLGYALAGIHHPAHGHHHHHRRLMPAIEDFKLQDLPWDNLNNAPDDFVVESITLTTTTTVFGNCAPTNPVHSTLTLVEHKSEPTPCWHNHYVYNVAAPEVYENHWHQYGPRPEPILPAPTDIRPAQPQLIQPKPAVLAVTEPEVTTTILKTQTITKTATNTVRVTVYPDVSPVPLANTPPGNPSKEEKAAALAATLPKGSLEEEKAVPVKRPPPPPKNNGGPIDAVLNLPNEVLPDLPVVNEILPGPKPHKPKPVEWTATPPKGQFSTRIRGTYSAKRKRHGDSLPGQCRKALGKQYHQRQSSRGTRLQICGAVYRSERCPVDGGCVE